MSKNVVAKEFLELQEEIVHLQGTWKHELASKPVNFNFHKDAVEEGRPLSAFTDFGIDIPLFLRWIDELNELLINFKSELRSELTGITNLLSDETVVEWFSEAFINNYLYFKNFAEEHGIQEWIPQFLAETVIRPYLYLIAELVQPEVDRMKPIECCPVCCEPVRLATLEEEGKKIMHCPRCLAHWHVNRLACAHCGNEDHKNIQFLSIEGDAASQIQVCEDCKGYTKIIDTRQYITKPSPALLDVNSIHLDIIAQDHGYFAVGEKKVIH